MSPDEPVTKTFIVDLLGGLVEKSDVSNHNDSVGGFGGE